MSGPGGVVVPAQVLLLEERVLDLALNLGSQTGFQVEMLSAGLCRWREIDQAIQWVIMIAAEQGVAVGWHGVKLPEKTRRLRFLLSLNWLVLPTSRTARFVAPY